MKLTKRGEYALRTLIRLGVAQRLGTPIVSVSRLAESEGIRGKCGGARLICDQEKTKMGDLIRFMDGKLAPIGCASETAYEPCTCPDIEHCGLRMLMIDVRNAIANILDRYSLGDVVTVTMKKMERDGLVPVIAPAGKGKSPARTQLPSKPRHADPGDGFLAGLLNGLGKLEK